MLVCVSSREVEDHHRSVMQPPWEAALDQQAYSKALVFNLSFKSVVVSEVAEQSLQFLEVALCMRQKVSLPTMLLLAYSPRKMSHGIFRLHIVRLDQLTILQLCQRYSKITIGHIEFLGFRSIDLALVEPCHPNFWVVHCKETLKDNAQITLLHLCQLGK